jgi:SNF2 family DNA or RNA helicase
VGTPALQDQAEDRAYRNGQMRLVVVKIPMVEDSIDQQLWGLLKGKRALARDLVEEEFDEGKAKALMASSLSSKSAGK